MTLARKPKNRVFGSSLHLLINPPSEQTRGFDQAQPRSARAAFFDRQHCPKVGCLRLFATACSHHYLKSYGPVVGDPMDGLWHTLKKSRSKRPWSPSFLRIFLTRVRAFKNWMNASRDPVTQTTRNWCPPSAIETPTTEETYRMMNPLSAGGPGAVDWECQRRPALTI